VRSVPWKQIVISVGIAVVVVWRIPFSSLRMAFRNLELRSLLLALLSFLVWYGLRTYKWHRLMVAAGNPRLRQSVRALFGGFALGLITPGRLGELGRCIFVRHAERAQVGLLTVYDRLLDFWALMTSVGVSLFLLASRPAAIFGLAVWLALLPVVMSFPALVSHLAQWARKSRHLRGHFMDAAISMPDLPTPHFAMLAVAAMMAELASFFFLLRAFFPTQFSTAIATYPYIALAGDLPVSFSGMGVREGAAALLLSSYAVPSGAAVDAALLWFVFAVLVPAAFGALWLVVERARARARRSDAVVVEPTPLWVPVGLPPPVTAAAPEPRAIPAP
jgi:uncharacterized membrane protein YbhN (UPF0104 family)